MNVGVRPENTLFVALLTLAVLACNPGPPGGADRTSLQSDALISIQQAKLLASDGEDFDRLGVAVAISGNTALVAADRDDDRGSDAGAVYVFVRSGAIWTQQAKLTAGDGAANEAFGSSVALSGDTAVIGAIFDAEVGGSALGAAYVFVRSGTTWSQQAKLIAADGTSDDQFGTSVAISGDTAVIGAVNDNDRGDHSGSAYVFVRSGAAWSQQAKLLAADGVAFDSFGISVAAAGDTAVAGAFGAGDRSGAAYVFVRAGTTWTQQAKLAAAGGTAGDQLGGAVALSGDTALIGASGADDHGDDSGAAYVFVRGGATWTQQAQLTAADGAGGDQLGGAVALDGDTALIGARFDGDLGAASGSAYVFGRSATTWSQQAKLTADDGAAVDFFGVSVALSGSSALIGAVGDDDHGSSSGAAYVFAPALAGNGDACTAGAQCGSGFCSDGVCCNTACGGGDPADCQACSVAAGAAANGTCAPRAAGIVCRAAGGACDVAERCTGTSGSCPTDGFSVAGTVCRAAAGACDVAERCTGTSGACPVNGFSGAGTVCRPAANGCDLRESCTGASALCPANEHRPDLSLCLGGLLGLPGVCLAGTCVL